jgi:hypothetical protein
VRTICSSACHALMLTNMLVPARWVTCHTITAQPLAATLHRA